MLREPKIPHWQAAIFLSWLVFLAFFGAYSGTPRNTPHQQETCATDNSPCDECRERQPHETIWQWLYRRTFCDPIAFYTLVLAAFTGLLAVVSIGQGIFLARADRTARIAAKAASDTADATQKTLIASNRAWVRVKVGVGPSAMSLNDRGIQFAASYELTNTGSAPALEVTIIMWL